MTPEEPTNPDEKEQMFSFLDEYFARGVDQRKFVDVSRIPLICQDILLIHKNVDKINDNITWLVRIIVGAVVLALLGTIIIHTVPLLPVL